MTWRRVRIAVLLYVLCMVGVGSWLTRARTTDWQETLWVTIYPINGDGSVASQRYVDALSGAHFAPISAYFAEEAQAYAVALDLPVRVALGARVDEHPPEPPKSSNPLGVAYWSLKLRFWSYWSVSRHGGPSDIDVYVKYYDPDTNPRLAHSLGLQKGMIGVVNAFADPAYTGSNQVVIGHEILHTLGASDLYDPRTGHPLAPAGLGDPEQSPRYPQAYAQLMAGRIAISSTQSAIPQHLRETLVGEQTAAEIGWLD